MSEKRKRKKQPGRLIIQKIDGDVYVVLESLETFRKSEDTREDGEVGEPTLKRLRFSRLREECSLEGQPDNCYFVLPIRYDFNGIDGKISRKYRSYGKKTRTS